MKLKTIVRYSQLEDPLGNKLPHCKVADAFKKEYELELEGINLYYQNGWKTRYDNDFKKKVLDVLGIKYNHILAYKFPVESLGENKEEIKLIADIGLNLDGFRCLKVQSLLE